MDFLIRTLTIPPMNMNERRVLRQFFKVQQCIRMLHRRIPQEFDLRESNALVFLEQQKSVSPAQLASLLQTTRSKVSRIVKRFEKESLCTVSVDMNDTRSRILELTANGKKALARIDQQANRESAMVIESLNRKEQNLFHAFLKELADALGATPQISRKNEVTIRAEQRRIALAGGLLAGDAFESTFSILQYHILQIACSAQEAVKSEVFFSLPFDAALVSRELDLLVAASLLERTADLSDRRRALIKISKKGEKKFLAAENNIIKLFQQLPSVQNSLQALEGVFVQIVQTLESIE